MNQFMNSGFDSGSEKKKVSALDATFELVKRIQEDVRASQALLRSRESNKEDMEELIWLLKEDNNHLKKRVEEAEEELKKFQDAKEKDKIQHEITSVDVNHGKQILEQEVERLNELLTRESERYKTLEISHLKRESMFKERESECFQLKSKVESLQKSLNNANNKEHEASKKLIETKQYASMLENNYENMKSSYQAEINRMQKSYQELSENYANMQLEHTKLQANCSILTRENESLTLSAKLASEAGFGVKKEPLESKFERSVLSHSSTILPSTTSTIPVKSYEPFNSIPTTPTFTGGNSFAHLHDPTDDSRTFKPSTSTLGRESPATAALSSSLSSLAVLAASSNRDKDLTDRPRHRFSMRRKMKEAPAVPTERTLLTIQELADGLDMLPGQSQSLTQRPTNPVSQLEEKVLMSSVGFGGPDRLLSPKNSDDENEDTNNQLGFNPRSSFFMTES